VKKAKEYKNWKYSIKMFLLYCHPH